MLGIITRLPGTILRAAIAMVAVPVMGLAGWVGYSHWSAAPPAGDTMGQLAVELATAHIAEALPLPSTPRTVLILPIEGDRSDDFFRGEVARAIATGGRFEVVDRTFTEKALGLVNVSWTDATLMSDDEARTAARRVDADAALVARLDLLRVAAGTEPEIDLQWRLVDARKMAGAESLAVAPQSVRIRAADVTASLPWHPLPWGWAIVLWFATALLLPLLLGGPLTKALGNESNVTNLMALLALTLFDALLALFFLGFRLDGYLAPLLALVATALAGVYNYLVLDQLEELRR